MDKLISAVSEDRMNLWERWIGYAILVTTPFIISPITVDSYLMPKYVWLGLWSALWFIVIGLRTSFRSFFRSPLEWPIGFLLCLTLISILIDYQSGIQIRAWMHLLMFAFLYYAFQRFWRIGGCPFMVVAILMITSSLLALYGILQDYGYDIFVNTGGVRDWRAKVIATLGNPNFLSEHLAITLPCILAFGLRRKTSTPVFILTAIVITLLVACHTVTFCVGVTTAYAVTIIVTITLAIFLKPRIRFSFTRLAIFLICTASAAGWYLLDNPYNSHGRSLYEEAWTSPQWWSGMGSRDFNWRTTRYMMEDAPLTGIGFGNYLSKHIHYQGINYEIQQHPHDRDFVIPVDQPHFQLLETAAEIGPLGVFALLWVVTSWVRAFILRYRRDSKNIWFLWGCWGGIWIALIHSFANFPFHVPASSLLFVMLASYPTAWMGASGTFAIKPSPLRILLLLAIAIPIALFNYFEYLGNQHLRNGLETQGLRSIAHLDTAKRYDPFSFQTYYMLGIRYLEVGLPGQAEKNLRMSLQYQEDLNVHRLLAQLYIDRNDLQGAIEEQRRVLELNPAYPGYYFSLAELLRKMDNSEEALKIEQKGKKLQKKLEEIN